MPDQVLALFAVGDVYASLCKKGVLPPSSDGMDSSADIDGIDVPKSSRKNASKKEESE